MNDQRVAFVLAGGGFKGAFELGALQHLILEVGIVPDVITATSAGGVLGTVVAQGRDVDACGVRLGEAEADLMAMTRTDVVFGEQPWLRELDGTSVADHIHRLVRQHGRPELDDDWDELEAEALAVIGTDAPEEASAPRAAAGARRNPFEQIASTTRALVDGQRAARGLPRAALNLDPFEASIRGRRDVGIATVDPALVARPGMDLRLAVTALKAKETHYVTEAGHLVGSDARSPIPGADGIDVIDGVIASASVPGVFPPRSLGKDHYVDGGCLQNIPLQAAVDLGATAIYTLVAVPVRPAKKTLSLWAAESLGYMSTQVENLAIDLPSGCTNTVIEPTIEVVASFEVHPGLMRIDMHYGRMRAEECLAGMDDGLDPIVKMASDTLTTMRLMAWRFEHRCIESGRVDGEQLERLRQLKCCVRSALDARSALGLPAPDGSDEWGQTWELHATPLPDGFPSDLT